MQSKKNIHIYQSAEQMDAASLRCAATLDPVTGIKETVELIMRVYGVTRVDLKKRNRNNLIMITKAG